MSKVSPLMLVILCTSILSVQMSGLHLHANVEGVSGLHGTHIHENDPDGHDHSGDTDVSVFELGNTFGKVLTFILPFVLSLLAVVFFSRQSWVSVGNSLHSRRHVRWRPPLRAPPLTIS